MSSTSPGPFALEVSHLIKKYPKAAARAVDDVSFTVQPGEIFGLLGPNGAGKTTTIAILTTRALPTSGTCRIMGVDVVRDAIGAKQLLSVVPQRANLDLSLNARDILTFHASYHGISKARRDKLADQLLAEFGLTERSKDLVSRYSGGMAQRVMIARALMHTPQVLFLDEPTNNLDPQTRLFLWERIRVLKERGITILLTTHDMEEASRLCDRIAIMDHGQILTCDTPAQLETLIPGGATLELRVLLPAAVPAHALVASGQSTGPQEEAPATQLQEVLRSLPGVSKVETVQASEGANAPTNLTVFRLYAEDVSSLTSQAVHVITEWNAELLDLHQGRPSLEDVFIYLTGRNIR